MYFSVNALFYGDYPKYARKLLQSLHENLEWHLVSDVKLGLNEVCQETLDMAFDFGKKFSKPCHIFLPDRNVYKYPLMSQMVHASPVELPAYTMWFDDDSALKRYDVLQNIRSIFSSSPEIWMAGHVWTKRFVGYQRGWVASRPWYTGKKWATSSGKEVYRFVTGGWWTIRTEVLTKWNWPDKDIIHNGGDTNLGELIRQQGGKLKSWKRGLDINSKLSGGYSNAPSRGEVFKPVGAADPNGPADYSHYDFTYQVFEL